MLNPFLLQISKIFYGLCWSRTTSVCQLESASLIFFSLAMVVFGLLGIILARVKISHFSLKGSSVRILGAVLLLGVACAFIPKYGLLIEIVLVLMVVVIGLLLSEKPVQHKPLPAETLTFQSGLDEPAYRLHLRLLKDGSGILILNAATVLHLNPTAAEFAYHMIKGSSPEATARQVARRYRISQADAHKDYTDFRDRVQTLIHTPDLDPTTFLDFERVAPHSKDLTAPLRLDCALTYRLPAGADASLAPTCAIAATNSAMLPMTAPYATATASPRPRGRRRSRASTSGPIRKTSSHVRNTVSTRELKPPRSARTRSSTAMPKNTAPSARKATRRVSRSGGVWPGDVIARSLSKRQRGGDEWPALKIPHRLVLTAPDPATQRRGAPPGSAQVGPGVRSPDHALDTGRRPCDRRARTRARSRYGRGIFVRHRCLPVSGVVRSEGDRAVPEGNAPTDPDAPTGLDGPRVDPGRPAIPRPPSSGPRRTR